ncbi:MAG TPA: TetR family transcriptional regulator, partial [Candidatus Brevibacterium intestinavium]|nr:TetR family transcriptional regulator [Candidatus Brevibacterium intestinavium]
MARKSAEVRREEILAATVEEIEATGLRTLRVADVADRLGLSASLVIYHFATKEALVAAAFDHAGRSDLEHARELAAGSGSARQRLRAVIGWYMPAGSTRSWKIWIDGWSAGLFDDDLKATFSALDQEWKTVLA